MISFFSSTLTKTLNAHRVLKIPRLPGCCKIIVLWCWLCFSTDYKCLCFYSTKSICTESVHVLFSLCYSKADDSSLTQLCHEESRSALLLQHRKIAFTWPCVLVSVYLQKYMNAPFNPYLQHCLAGLNVFCLASVNKSLNSDSLAALLQSVMQQRFAVIAAFSYVAVFDLMKNVNRQAGYVTQCMVSARLVIGLKTEPHWVCDLTRTCDVCLNLMSHVGG